MRLAIKPTTCWIHFQKLTLPHSQPVLLFLPIQLQASLSFWKSLMLMWKKKRYKWHYKTNRNTNKERKSAGSSKQETRRNTITCWHKKSEVCARDSDWWWLPPRLLKWELCLLKKPRGTKIYSFLEKNIITCIYWMTNSLQTSSYSFSACSARWRSSWSLFSNWED